ncbi:MAG: hypothetical protein HOE11_00215 [Candidatus Diapherotrites archaeon]|nr:hypothetical protein [Candidatus Diapherotrites archaeon]MBT4597281.1 hypothetical protein [Candidatus Diapherotrites archaeon]
MISVKIFFTIFLILLISFSFALPNSIKSFEVDKDTLTITQQCVANDATATLVVKSGMFEQTFNSVICGLTPTEFDTALTTLEEGIYSFTLTINTDCLTCSSTQFVEILDKNKEIQIPDNNLFLTIIIAFSIIGLIVVNKKEN